MDFIDFFAEKAARANRARPQDYIKDGLLFCGDCHTPKQCVVQALGENRVFACVCKCESEKIEAEKAAIRHQRKVDKAIELCNELGFPAVEIIDKTFDKADNRNPELMAMAKNYAEHFDDFLLSGKGLLMYGDVGTGKSYAATCIVNYLVQRGYPAAITNFARIQSVAMSMFDGRQAYFDSFNKLALLVIDDLFAERDTSTMAETIHAVIDARSRARLPLIVTTNKTAQDFKKATDLNERRIISRLAELTHPVSVTGTDRRMEKQRTEYTKYKEILKNGGQE